jgi:hypothetical protein
MREKVELAAGDVLDRNDVIKLIQLPQLNKIVN